MMYRVGQLVVCYLFCVLRYHLTSCLIVCFTLRTGKCFNVDIFGQGPHTGAIKDFARDHQLPVRGE